MAEERIVVRLVLDTSGYRQGASQARSATDSITEGASKTDGALGKLKGTFGGVAKVAAGAFAAKQVLDFAQSSITAASDLEESMNAVNVVFGEGSSIINEFGSTAATQVGLAQSKFNELATNSGALLTNFGFSQKDAAEESINLTKRAADMASVFNTDVGDALFAVQAALRGETEPIRRFGVSLDDASIRAKAVELGLAATTSEVDKNAKAQAALALVYDQTSKVQGDFANTSDSLANRQRILAAQFEDAKAKIGQALIPVMTEILSVASDLLPTFTDIATAIGNVVGALSPLIGLAGDLLGLALKPLVKWFEFLGKGITSITSLWDPAAKAALRFQEAQEGIVKATEEGGSQSAAYANGLLHLARSGTLTADALRDLGQDVEFVGEQKAEATRRALEQARAEEASADAIAVLEDALLAEIQALGYSEDKQQEMIEAWGLGEAAARAQAEASEGAGDAAAGAAGGIDENTEALEDNAAAADAAREALRAYLDELAGATNSALKAVNSLDDLRTAQDKVNELANKGKTDTDEYRLAQLELAAQVFETEQALQDFSGGGVEDAIDGIAAALQISSEEARDLLEELGLIDGKKVQSVIDLRYTATGPQSAQKLAERFAFNLRQHGGPVKAGDPYVVGEAGPEIFIPNQSGRIVSNEEATKTGSSAMGIKGGDRNLTVVFNDSRLAEDPRDAVRESFALDSLFGGNV